MVLTMGGLNWRRLAGTKGYFFLQKEAMGWKEQSGLLIEEGTG